MLLSSLFLLEFVVSFCELIMPIVKRATQIKSITIEKGIYPTASRMGLGLSEKYLGLQPSRPVLDTPLIVITGAHNYCENRITRARP